VPGQQSVAISLWSVSDSATAELMRAWLMRALNGLSQVRHNGVLRV
jgi:CHAT domain-containing protein